MTDEATVTESDASPEELETFSGNLHFCGPDNRLSPLLGEMPFLLYWCKRNTGATYFPVGMWNNTDMSPKDEVAKADILEFRFKTAAGQPITAADLANSGPYPGPPLEWRRAGGAWLRPSQRKGQEYYIAVTPPNRPSESDYSGRNLMEGVQSSVVYAGGVRFSLRMSIRSKGDAWISDEDVTGSIRMQDNQTRSAFMVAVRYGDNDPFGSHTAFYKRKDLNI
ncbi:hypothetical protein ACQP0C_16845 [Nocardia sp. CA-129566]|uniref:hypothetical protein n=1 Tax=Nocardia sp. CA-129566 TaxID=3239976 RepID=UPI003D9642D3